jgi:hypothetical protein
MILVLEFALSFMALCEDKFNIFFTKTTALLAITPRFPHNIFHGRNTAQFLLCCVYPHRGAVMFMTGYMKQM